MVLTTDEKPPETKDTPLLSAPVAPFPLPAVTADTTKTWTYAKAIINSKQTLVLTAVDPNNATKMIQVNIYASAYDSTGRYPMKWAVVEISYVDAF